MIIGYTSFNMSCKLKVKDPYIQSFLGESEFDSFKEFTEAIQNAVEAKSLMPVKLPDNSTRFAKVLKTEKGYNIGQTDIHPESVAAYLLTNFSTDKNQVENLIKAEFKAIQEKPQLEVKDLNLLKDFLSLSQAGMPELYEALEEYINYFSTTYEPPVLEESDEVYLYTTRPSVESKVEDRLVIASEVDIARQSFLQSLSKGLITVDGEQIPRSEVFLRVEPDSLDYIQTDEITEDQLRNVVIFYLKQGESFTPLYIHKSTSPKLGREIKFTTQSNEAFQIKGKTQLGFWLPNIEDPSYEKYYPAPFGIPESVKKAAGDFKNQPDGKFYQFSIIANTATTHTPSIKGGRNVKQVTYRNPETFSQGKPLTLSAAQEKAPGVFKGQIIGRVDDVDVPFFNTPLHEDYRKDAVELLELAFTTDSVETKKKIADYLNLIYEHTNSDFHFLVTKSGEFIAKTNVKAVSGKIVPLPSPQKLTVDNFKSLLPFVKVKVKKEFLESGTTFKTLKVENGQIVEKTVMADKWINQHLRTNAAQTQFGSELRNVKWYNAYVTFSASTGNVIDASENQVFTVEELIKKAKEEDFSPEAYRLFQLIVDANLYDKVKTMPVTIGDLNLFRGNSIELNSQGKLGDNLTHELIHALTAEWIQENPNSEVTQRLIAIAKQIDFKYGDFTDEILIAQEFIASLGQKPIIEKLKEQPSIFDELQDLIRQIFNAIFGIERNLYTEAVQHFIAIAHGNTLRAGETNIVTGERKRPNKKTSTSFRNLGATPDEALTSFRKKIESEKGATYLDTVVQSIAGDLSSYLSQDMVALLSGELNYDDIWDKLYDTYLIQRWDENDNLILSNTEREYFLDLVLDNEDYIKQIFRTDNKIFTFRKSKPGVSKTVIDDQVETTQIQVSDEEDTEQIETPEESVIETSEEDQAKQDLKETLEGATKPQAEFGRNGNTYSFDEAEKEVRYIIKMLPAIETLDGKPRIYSIEERRQAILNDVSLTSQFFYPINKEKTEYIRLAKDVNGAVKLNDNMTTWNKLGSMFRDNLSLYDMMENTFHNPKTREIVPEFYALYSWLHLPTEEGFSMNVTNENVHIYAKIETAFKRFSNPLWKTLNTNGVMNAVDEGADTTGLTDKIVDDRFRRNIELYKAEEFFDIDTSTFNLTEFKKSRKLDDDAVIEFLGFEFAPEAKTTGNYSSRFKPALLEFIRKSGRESSIPIGITNFIRNDYEGPEVVEKEKSKKAPSLNSSYKFIHKAQHKIYPYTFSSMVKNAEGENQSTDSLPNSILLDAHIYNTQSLEEIKRLIPRANNPMFTKTIAYKSMFNKDGSRNKNKLLVENFNGVSNVEEGSASTGALNVDLEEDVKVLNDFISLLTEGISENTRAQVSTTSYSTRLDTYNGHVVPFLYETTTKVLKDEAKVTDYFYKIWIGYLEGELLEGHGEFFMFDFLTEDLQKKLLEPTALVDGILREDLQKLFIVELRNLFVEEAKAFGQALNAAGGLTAALPEGASNKLTTILAKEKDNNKGKPKEEIEAEVEENFLFYFIANKKTLYVEEITLFQGSLSVLGNKYFKRANTVQSTRIPPSSTQAIRDVVNRLIKSNSFATSLFGDQTAFVLEDQFKSAIKTDYEEKSPHLTKMLEGYVASAFEFYKSIGQERSVEDLITEAENLLEKYNEVNVSDGGGNISPDAYMAYMMSLGSNPKMFKAYKALMYDMIANKELYFAEEMRNNRNIFPESFWNSTLTQTQIEEMNEGLKLIEKGEVVFPTLKWTYRGGVVTDDKVAPEALNKFSLFPLFIQYVYDKPVLKAEFLGMLQQRLAYTKFESGEKMLQDLKTDISAQFSKPIIDFSDSTHTLLTHNLGEQIKTPTQAKQENTYGSQVRKLIVSVLKSIDNSTIQEYLSDWEKVNKKISASIKDKILKDFGVEDDINNPDLKAVARILRENALNREMTKNVIQFLEAVESGDYSNFGASFNKKEVENLISNVIRRIAVQKLKGAQLIQVTSAQDHVTDRLAWYTDGKPAECKVSLMGSYQNLLNLPEVQAEVAKMDPSQVNIVSRTRVLNRLLRDQAFRTKYEKELTLVTYRIPTQGLNSMDVYTIKEFLPPFQSPQIVLPPEATVKSGTDYDYDKASAIFPSIGKDGRLVTGTVPTESVKELSTKLESLKEKLSPLFAAKKDLKDFFTQMESIEDAIENPNLSPYEILKLVRGGGFIEAQLKENLDNLYKEYGKDFKEFLVTKKKLQLKKNASLLEQNKILETAKGILLHPLNYFRLITPNSDSIIMDAAKEVFTAMGIETGEPRGHKIIDYLTNLRKWRVVKGKNLLGIAAVANTFYTLLQTYNAKFSTQFNLKYTRKETAKLAQVHFGLLTEDEKNKIVQIEIGEKGKQTSWIDATSNFDAEGKVMKQELISQLINVTVDMPGNDKFGYLNFHKGNFGAALYLIMVQGVPFKRILKLFHQPAIYQYDNLVNRYKKTMNAREAKLTALSDLLGLEIPTKETGGSALGVMFDMEYDTEREAEEIKDFKKFEDILHNHIEKIKKKVSHDMLPDLTERATVLSQPMDETQQTILAYYVSVLNESEEMRKVDRTVNFDRSPDNIVMKTVDRKNLRKEVVDAGFIDPNFVEKVTKDSMISGLDTTEVIQGISKALFPSLYLPVNVIAFETMSRDVLKKDVFFNKVTNDFLSSIVQNFAVIEHEGQDQKMKDVGDFYILGKGRFELVKQANRLRQELAKSGRKMRLLEVMLNSVSKAGDKNNIQLFMGFENASPDKDHLTENFRELLKDPKTRDFATALISTGIIQSGYSKSPLFFSDIIPEEFITPVIDRANNEYLSLDKDKKEDYVKIFDKRFRINEGFLFNNKSGVREAYRYKDYQFEDFFDLNNPSRQLPAPVEPAPVQPILPSSEIKGEEISSYSDNLAFALTNPTHTSPTGKVWSRSWTEGQKKWRDYLSKGISFNGITYKDVEEAYQKNKDKYPIGESRNEFMKDLIKIKLQTYPKLVEGIDAKGGLGFILKSTHQPTKQNSYWETGGENGFIRMLAKAYSEVKGEVQPTQEQPTDIQIAEEIYNQLGDKTVTGNVRLEEWKYLKDRERAIVSNIETVMPREELQNLPSSDMRWAAIGDVFYDWWGKKYTIVSAKDKYGRSKEYKIEERDIETGKTVQIDMKSFNPKTSGAFELLTKDPIDILRQAQKKRHVSIIVSTRIAGSNFHFGNPFSSDEKVLAQNKGLIKTSSTKESVIRYIDWVLNSNDQRAQWIRSEIKTGDLKGAMVYYYTELGEPSHATALYWLINDPSSPFNQVSEVKSPVDSTEPVSTPVSQDDFKYYGTTYKIDLDESRMAIDVPDLKQGQNETNSKFKERKQKILDAYNTNPDVDPQNGKKFRNFEADKIYEPKPTKLNVVVPQGSNPNNQEIFRDEENIYLMNDDQQKAYDTIKSFVLERLKAPRSYGGQMQEFTDPLAKPYSGVIPTEMWNNMIGLSGRGGTGKTTVIRKIIEDVQKEYSSGDFWRSLNIKYVAPTHNAVTMLQESLGLDSEQVGSVKTGASFVARNQRKGSEDAEKGKETEELWLLRSDIYLERVKKGVIDPISRMDIVIIDESSMIDKQFIADVLLRLETEEAGSYPIMIYMGDYRQLPPPDSESSGSFKEGVISATLFSDQNKDKFVELKQVMRSKDAMFHQIFDSVGNQITEQRKQILKGEQPSKFDFSIYDKITNSSSENLLVVNERQVDGVVDIYTDVLTKSDNPYEMFWVHYNRLDRPETQVLFKKIRESYFKKLGQEIKSEDIQTGDYAQFTGSLPLETIENKDRKITKGIVKPTARVKIKEMGTKKVTFDGRHPIVDLFGNVVLNMEYMIILNRQGRERYITSLEAGLLKIGKYDSATKTIAMTLKTADGKELTKKVPYYLYKQHQQYLTNLSMSLNKMFKPSYIGSTHTVQGASIKKVIAGDYNVRKNAPNINMRDMESSLYTMLTRTSQQLIIIKPDIIQLENNQSNFKINLDNITKPITDDTTTNDCASF